MEEQAPTSIDEMPPLAPAPAQLPPLVHPPPLASVPVQFETLSLNTPLQPIPPLPECPAPVTGELSPAEKLVNDQLAANASGDASLMSEAGKRGTFRHLSVIEWENVWHCRNAHHRTAEHVDAKRSERIQGTDTKGKGCSDQDWQW